MGTVKYEIYNYINPLKMPAIIASIQPLYRVEDVMTGVLKGLISNTVQYVSSGLVKKTFKTSIHSLLQWEILI